MTPKSFIVQIFFLCLLFASLPSAQAVSEEKDTLQSAGPPSALQTLKDLRLSIEAIDKDILEKEESYAKALMEERKKAIRMEVSHLLRLKDAYQREFESIASGIEIEETAQAPLKAFRIEEELMEVLRPLVEGLKQMTSRPRELERLRKDITFYENHLPEIRYAISKVEGFMAKTEDEQLSLHLEELLMNWQEKEQEVIRQIRRLRFQLEQKTGPDESMLVTMQKGVTNFVKTRGRNLFLAFSAFITTFLLLRLAYWKWSQNQKKSPPPFYHRLLQVIFHSTTAFVSVSAALLLLYAFGDWMLLSIALLLLITLIWSARNGMAQFWEQGKLILNMGTLREGERVIYTGLPWKVQKLGLHGILINPSLEGGMLRIPLKHLVGMQSRPYEEDEPWFPSEKNDVLLLEDGSIAKILMQTPEQVVAELEGGARRTWAAVDFLGLSLCNLSRKKFGISVTMGLDYGYQAEITNKIPGLLEQYVRKHLDRENHNRYLQYLDVIFLETGPYALNLRVFAVFSPEAAEEYLNLQRKIRKLCMEASSHYGWCIPFPRLALHRPASD
ncbi:hypothetical protein LZ24_01283 [Desulfobotulus alkaliphilus]|uniref:Small-conductance mechanosensitive channel n=1 Tax=Desulfobotulus alkaliphilus TaxID=622671 RepID=A0A562RXT8_9BACT|nr:hypothetical protein [Desulfobotulus alkaliphilus]TWI73196.1 hypothetical protein LZ24_01283 [Desulfobotulus alkaliphilus]